MIHFYRVESLSKAQSFYIDLLGLTLFKDQGKCQIYQTSQGHLIGFCTHFPNQKIEQSCITFVYDSVQDVDEVYLKLNTQGYILEKPTINHFFNIYHFFMKDPNDLTLEFQVFLKP